MLRDVSSRDMERILALPEPHRRRARHVVTENERVLSAVECLRARRSAALGALLNESHESLRTDFEVSVPEVDRLVALARRQPHCFGARMTGGGFGGAIVALAAAGHGADIGRDVVGAYGPAGRLLVPQRRRSE
jgi:galactokinase